VLAVGEGQRERLRGRGKLRAEAVGLKLRAVSQIAAADAGGKAEEILDQRRGPGLAARRVAFQHHGFQPFGSGIDRGGEPRRTRADDGQIAGDFALIHPPASRSSPATCATSRSEGRRSGMPFAVISAGKSRLARFRRSHSGAPVFAFKIDQPVRDVILVEEIVELQAFARALLRHDPPPGKLAVALAAAGGA
jgi:hypothetical protein